MSRLLGFEAPRPASIVG